MISRNSFWNSFAHELHCVRHLATKIQPDMLDYRPTPGQRSMLELMQYTSFIYAAMADALANETNDNYGPRMQSAQSVTLENFIDTMHAQELELKQLFESVSDDDMDREYDLFGIRTKAEHFMTHLKIASAYKMQLFLYIKSCGVSTIGTMDVWAGMDTPPQTD